MVVCIDTFKQKWSFWTSPHWARLIDTLSRSSRNLSRRGESLDLQTPHSQSREKVAPTHTARDREKMATLQDNQSKMQHKKGNEKMKKDTGKWCEYHKIPWHNTEECHSKKSLVVEMKASESEVDSDSESNPKEGSRLSMLNPVPLSLPPKSSQANQKNQRKGNASFTHRCG
jgi:hypothetical protein